MGVPPPSLPIEEMPLEDDEMLTPPGVKDGRRVLDGVPAFPRFGVRLFFLGVVLEAFCVFPIVREALGEAVLSANTLLSFLSELSFSPAPFTNCR